MKQFIFKKGVFLLIFILPFFFLLSLVSGVKIGEDNIRGVIIKQSEEVSSSVNYSIALNGSYVPYIGANTNVDIRPYDFSTANLTLTTDLTVANGGTGRSSHTARALIAGATTTSGAQTSIANSATTGVILRGAGTSAYPAWTTATYPATTSDNSFLISTGTNVIGGTDTSLTWDGSTLLAATGTLNMMSFKLGGATNGVNFDNSAGVLTMQGSKTGGTHEALSIDFESVANTIGFASGAGTGVTAITFSSLNLSTTGYIAVAGINFNSNFSILNDANLKFITNKTGGAGIAWFSNNISATGYMTRTSVYDKSKGLALSKIKDASEFLDDKGEIIHSRFYGYVTYPVTDYSKPIMIKLCANETNDEGIEKEVCKDVVIYPYTKPEEAVNLVEEIALLHQAVYELKEQLEILQGK